MSDAPDADALCRRVRDVVGSVADPEIPVLTLADLGLLQSVTVSDRGRIEVSIVPTYSGCPAMETMALEVRWALERAGFSDTVVRTVLAPAWTTDWISEEGRRKLREYGIAPPVRGGGRSTLFGEARIACPRCGSADSERLSEFGSTACKSLWRCRSCREPFEHFKCH